MPGSRHIYANDSFVVSGIALAAQKYENRYLHARSRESSWSHEVVDLPGVARQRMVVAQMPAHHGAVLAFDQGIVIG